MKHEAKTTIEISAIMPSPRNARSDCEMTKAELNGIAQSMKSTGLINPVTVRKLYDGMSSIIKQGGAWQLFRGDHLIAGGLTKKQAEMFHDKYRTATYEVIAGHRRLAAAKLLGWSEIDCIVVDVSQDEANEIMAVENVQRQDLSPVDEGAAIARLFDSGMKAQDIADRIGKSPLYVIRRSKLAELIPEIAKATTDAENKWSRVPVRVLEFLSAMPEAYQKVTFDEAKTQPWMLEHGAGSIARDISEHATGLLKSAAFETDDALLVAKAGPCTECKKRSSINPGLFDDEISDQKAIAINDRCLDMDCFWKKMRVVTDAKMLSLENHGVGALLVEADGNAQWRKNMKYDDDVKMLRCHEYTKVKAGTKGAKEAVMIGGRNSGSRVWVMTHETDRNGYQKPQRAKKADLPEPKTEAEAMERKCERATERLEALMMRRKAWACGRVQDMIRSTMDKPERDNEHDDKAIEPIAGVSRPRFDKIWRLAAAVGTASRRDSLYVVTYTGEPGGESKQDGAWAYYGDEIPDDQVWVKLWNDVAPVLIGRLRVYGVGKCQPQFDEACNSLVMLGFARNVTEAASYILVEAKDTIPTPKSLLDYESNGFGPPNSPGKVESAGARSCAGDGQSENAATGQPEASTGKAEKAKKPLKNAKQKTKLKVTE